MGYEHVKGRDWEWVHEMKNPAGSLRYYADGLRKHDVRGQAWRLAKTSYEELRAMPVQILDALVKILEPVLERAKRARTLQ